MTTPTPTERLDAAEFDLLVCNVRLEDLAARLGVTEVAR